MRKSHIIIFIVTFFNLLNCKGQDKKKHDKEQMFEVSENIKSKDNKINVEEILIKQLESGVSGLYNETSDGETYEYEGKDLDAIIPILKKELEVSGFKFLNSEEFNLKINTIFRRIIDLKSDSKYLYISPVEKCKREISFYRNKYTASANIPSYYIVKNDNFLTELYAIPEVIDYQKEYPKIAKLEDTINTYIIKDGNNVELTLWKNYINNQDDSNLRKRRRFNQQLLISRNKYLFNDDQSQFAWLINNDEYFMKSLVTTFGYTEDKKLLKWVIENTELPLFYKYAKSEILDNLGRLLWTKDCNGNIRVHQNTLDILKELSPPENNLNIMYVAEYLTNNLEENQDLNDSQKAKIAAYLLYWGEQFKYDKRYDLNQMFMGHYYHYMDDGTYEKEFIKNNYYGLPKFKEWYEAAKKEKDCFNGGAHLEDDPQPLDYESRAKYIK